MGLSLYLGTVIFLGSRKSRASILSTSRNPVFSTAERSNRQTTQRSANLVRNQLQFSCRKQGFLSACQFSPTRRLSKYSARHFNLSKFWLLTFSSRKAVLDKIFSYISVIFKKPFVNSYLTYSLYQINTIVTPAKTCFPQLIIKSVFSN